MLYSGENKLFRFSEGCCESLPGTVITSEAAAVLGRTVAGHFRRFAAGCDSFSHIHHLYALCSGISEAGRDVYVYENTDMPSFKFSYPLLSADCGIYISGSGCLKISIFRADRLPVKAEKLADIMNGSAAGTAPRCGKITAAGSFRDIYISNLTDSLNVAELPFSAGVSCGTRSVRSLWENFFTGTDDRLSFQVSADGQRVNAYSAENGFISMDKLRLAYAAAEYGDSPVRLPCSFHPDAEKSGIKIERLPDEQFKEGSAEIPRFIVDPLYMCVRLASDRRRLDSILRGLPELAAAECEITADFRSTRAFRRILDDSSGRVILSRTGRNRLSLTVQAHSSETAAELCGRWTDKLNRLCAEYYADELQF